LSKVSCSNSARTTEVVTKVIVLGSALRKSLPVSIGVNLNVVSSDTSRAGSLLPRDSGRAVKRSSADRRSSRGGGHSINSRRRPLASSAGVGSHLEGDRVSTAVKSVAELVEGETVGIILVVNTIV
jgi:hypothetical protein